MTELERAFYEFARQAVKTDDGYTMSVRIPGYSCDKLLELIDALIELGWICKAKKIGQEYMRAQLTKEGYEKYFELENRDQEHE